MASSIVLPHGTYAAGTRVVGPATVPSGVSGFSLALDRGEWLAGVTIQMTVDLSIDSGATWNNPPESVVPYPLGLSAEGGAALDKNGVLYPQTILAAPIPNSGSSTRRIRANLTITGGSLTTTGTLTTI